MKISTAFVSAGLIFELYALAGRAAEVTPITPLEYRDLEADQSLWKIDGWFPLHRPSGEISIDDKNSVTTAGFDWHVGAGANLVTLSYDASQSLMTFSASGSGGAETVVGRTMPVDSIAWRLLAFGLSNDVPALTMSELRVNGLSYSGEWSANKDQPFNTFVASAPGGVESVSFVIDWGGPEEYEKFSIQAIGFQSIPEPGTLSYIILGFLMFIAIGRFVKTSYRAPD